MNRFPSIDMAATGANIAALRRTAGMSVVDLQNIFGFSTPQAIYKWQRGETLPSTDNLLALGFILEVPIENILIFQTIEQSEPQEKSCGSDFFGVQKSGPLSPPSGPEPKLSPGSKSPSKLSVPGISPRPGISGSSSFSNGFP